MDCPTFKTMLKDEYHTLTHKAERATDALVSFYMKEMERVVQDKTMRRLPLATSHECDAYALVPVDAYERLYKHSWDFYRE